MLCSTSQTEGYPQSKVAEQLSDTIPPDYATSLNVVYFPQLGTTSDATDASDGLTHRI